MQEESSCCFQVSPDLVAAKHCEWIREEINSRKNKELWVLYSDVFGDWCLTGGGEFTWYGSSFRQNPSVHCCHTCRCRPLSSVSVRPAIMSAVLWGRRREEDEKFWELMRQAEEKLFVGAAELKRRSNWLEEKSEFHRADVETKCKWVQSQRWRWKILLFWGLGKKIQTLFNVYSGIKNQTETKTERLTFEWPPASTRLLKSDLLWPFVVSSLVEGEQTHVSHGQFYVKLFCKHFSVWETLTFFLLLCLGKRKSTCG